MGKPTSKSTASYALVRHSDAPRPARIGLPFSIGSSSLADVIINSNAVSACGLIAYVDEHGVLALHDPERDLRAPLTRLQNYGLQVIGPVFGEPEHTGIKRVLNEVLAAEQARFGRVPPPVRAALGGRFSQKARLGAWAAVAVAALTFFVALPKERTEQADLSQMDINLKVGDLLAGQVGASTKYPDFRKGFTLAFEATPALAGQKAAFRFAVHGLDKAGELHATLNGTAIYTSETELECVSEYCVKDIAIPAKLIKPGRNVISWTHEPEDSDYMVKEILLSPLHELSADRRAVVQNIFAHAQRAFDERGIVYENLLVARNELRRLDMMLIEALGLDDMKAATRALHIQVDRELKQLVADLEFKVDQAVQLQKYDQAESSLKALLTLFPDARTPEHLGYAQRLNEIKETEK